MARYKIMRVGSHSASGRRLAIWLGILLVLAVAILAAQPVGDGDLFFHLAYARQMLQHHTLIVDHTQFSWTPASNRTIYCAWASELILFGLWNAFGLMSLFVLRYLVLMGAVALAWHYGRRADRNHTALRGLVLLVMSLAMIGAAEIKPELFSILFFNLLVWIYFRAKLTVKSKALFCVPVLMAVWVNFHGGFVLAAPFLAATAVGEVANRWFSPKTALPRPAFHRLGMAWALCVPAILLTPYTWRYPVQLVEDYILSPARPDIAWNNAHQAIFSELGWDAFYPELLLLMAAILALVVIARRKSEAGVDWAVLAANAVYIPFFIVYLRTAFLWPIVFGYSVFFLLPRKSILPEGNYGRTISLGSVTALVLLASAELWTAVTRPAMGAWLGFGIGYVNPVVEADYIADHDLPPRLYNTFNSGAYLIWRLYPRYRVMVDSRSFPYLDWFQDQYDFTLGRRFDELLQKYPADAAMIAFTALSNWHRFAESRDWRPVFYGPTGAVFVRRNARPDLRLDDAGPRRFENIRNGESALQAFDFAVYIGDDHTAWNILAVVEQRLAYQVKRADLAEARAYREGHAALRAHNYGQAIERFNAAFRRKARGPRDRLLATLLAAIQRANGADVSAIKRGIDRLESDVW